MATIYAVLYRISVKILIDLRAREGGGGGGGGLRVEGILSIVFNLQPKTRRVKHSHTFAIFEEGKRPFQASAGNRYPFSPSILSSDFGPKEKKGVKSVHLQHLKQKG